NAAKASSRLRATAAEPGRTGRAARYCSAIAISGSVLRVRGSADMVSGRVAAILGIAGRLEFQRKLLAARAHDASSRHHVHEIRHDVLEEALVMGNDEHRTPGIAQRVDAAGDDAQRVDVEAGIGLVEDGELR